MNKVEIPGIAVQGHVLITDITNPSTPMVVIDKMNAIHPENMSQAIANALAANTSSQGISLGAISEMRFGKHIALYCSDAISKLL